MIVELYVVIGLIIMCFNWIIVNYYLYLLGRKVVKKYNEYLKDRV